jgi:hypothetical protein
MSNRTSDTGPLTPVDFLNALRARGVRLERDPGAASGASVAGPPDALTPQLVARIQRALPRLLPHLDQYAEVVRLGAVVEALLTEEEEEAQVLLTDRLLVWLEKVLAQRRELEAAHGPHWWRNTPEGRDLLSDLRAFRDAFRQ